MMIAIPIDVGGTRGNMGSLRLTGSIARNLAIHILSGRYKPGDPIGGEVDASRQFGVSRATYREAMRILCAKGLLERRQRIGTRVAASEKWHWLDSDILAWIFESEGMSESLDGFLELRRTIEPEVAALAALRHTPEQLAEMQRALELMASSKPLLKLSRMPLRQFRTALYRAGKNPFFGNFGDLIETVAIAVDHSVATSVINGSYVEVFNAISKRDSPSARSAMRDVIDRAWHHIQPQRAKAL